MNSGNLASIFALALLLLSSSPVSASESWWARGLDIVNKLDDSSGTESDSGNNLAASEVAAAFREALRIGSENVVSQLGSVDGFNSDPAIHIPLPGELDRVKAVLAKVGASPIIDDLELKLNRAAEAATPKAKALFVQAISEMSFDDVMAIYNGPKDSATRYFQQKMSPSLRTEMAPIVDNSLAEVGAIRAYEKVMGDYQALPFVPDVKANLTNHVVGKGMDGIFHYLALEETAIREDPVKRTTALLQKVFGAK